MKICVVSFDFWDYDHYIVKALSKKGVESHHIKIGAVSHAGLQEKVLNALSKVVLKKNLKHEKRQKYVISSLEKLGFQDQILVLNPDVFTHETLAYIRSKTNRLITFLYDNLQRFPVQDKLHFFDKVFSFDDADVQKYGFEKLCNYNYLDLQPQAENSSDLDLFYVTSYDKSRNKIIYPLVRKLLQINSVFQIVVVGKKAWVPKLKYSINPQKSRVPVIFKRKAIGTGIILDFYKRTKSILDLMRSGQTGLSFRVFEAMAFEKKIITNNPTIKNYDFYNPKNILILNEDFSNLTPEFFNSPYEKIPEDIYQKYTLDSWVNYVFDLKK
ncbi:CgeB family protein [Amniculibacterium aquaticum]|uniref:hypothetical protein n=1 Tax=Amniculibacterium aquaticum TaxID=2479858 RepID=UPI000F59CD4F|nr:hypothetical protein [Amniculibacterium aquaticum]